MTTKKDAAKAPKGTSSAEAIASYDKLLATVPETERKGAANLYTAVNGNMYTLLLPPGRLAIRLPEEEREKFVKKHEAKLFEAYGTVMPEYVAVPEGMLDKTRELTKYLEISLAYAKKLRPKATTKKKS